MKKQLSFIALMCILTLSSFAQIKGNYLKVKGEARVFAVPELMVLNIPLEVSNPTYSECSDALIQKYNQMVKALVKNGFDQNKIKSSGLSITEKYKWNRNMREKDGFQGRIQMELEVMHTKEKLNSFMQTLKNDRFDYGYNLSFKLSEEQKEVLLKQAIDSAVKNAQTKAEFLASSLGVKLLKIKDVNFDVEGFSAGPLLRESSLMRMDAEQSGGGDISLEAKEQQINKAVIITWKIKQ